MTLRNVIHKGAMTVNIFSSKSSGAGDRRTLVLFDISRLISRIKRAAPTGIDRVELAYARWLMHEVDTGLRFVAVVGGKPRIVNDAVARRIIRILSREWSGRGLQANADELERIAAFLNSSWHPSKEQERQAAEAPTVEDLMAAAPDERGPNGFGLANPARLWARRPIKRIVSQAHASGHFVIYLNVSHHHLEKKYVFENLKATGVDQVVVMIHDIIPLDYPEYCRRGDAEKHRQRINTVAEHVDVVIANSLDTARRLKPLLSRRKVDIVTSHLGLDLVVHPRRSLGHFGSSDPYFVIVSTIEARKNHLILLKVWRQLVERHGHKAPKLVVVGRRGWEAEAAIDMLERCRTLCSHVYETEKLTDSDVIALMTGARAALMPSFAEGFGLPVAEALTLGVPVIASDNPALVEVGQGISEHLDPLDGPGWGAAIMDYADPASKRRKEQMERLTAFEPFRWRNHFGPVAKELGLALNQVVTSG